MRGIVTEITKSEFLQACNEKVRLDDLQDSEAERRRREEEERRRREEEEERRRRKEAERIAREEAERRRREEADRIAREEAERRRREEAERIARENSDWDAWYRNVPNACKRGFDVGDFRYSIDANQRKIYKTSNLGGTVIGFTSEGINEELGI